MENKVKFGLKNVHYALQTKGEDGAVSFGPPVRILGGVSLSMDAEGESSEFYADDVAYYVSAADEGYSGTLSVALIPVSFRKDVLGEVEDETSHVMIERADAEPKPFALLFEFNGDQKATRHVLYNCSATRPGLSGETLKGKKEPSTDSLKLTAPPMADGLVKASTKADTPADVYNNWYKSVWLPPAGEASA